METFETVLGKFSCYQNDQNFYYHLKNGGFWETELILKHLRPYWQQASLILDIGAHIGSHSFVYGYYNPLAKILAFEPQREIYKLLVENMKERPNVTPYNVCVGHMNTVTSLSEKTHCGENTEEKVTYGEGPIMNLGGMAIGKGGQKALMITIDSLNLNRCDYIKMDVEGAEGLVIQGAANTIRKFRPVICYEYVDYLDTSGLSQTLGLSELPNPKKELEALGYKEFVHLEGENWLALP